MMDAPYRVRVPFKEAIFAGFEQWRSKFLETAALRVRRDINNIVCAVKASAVLHKAQREVVSLKTAGIRLMAAVDHRALEQDDSHTGRGAARFFKIVKTAKAISVQRLVLPAHNPALVVGDRGDQCRAPSVGFITPVTSRDAQDLAEIEKASGVDPPRMAVSRRSKTAGTTRSKALPSVSVQPARRFILQRGSRTR
jgi:hypothetical protein